MRTTPPIYKYSGMIAGFGLAAVLIGVIILLASPAMKMAAWMILALGAALLIAAFIIDFSKVKGAVTGKRGRFSTGNTVMAFVFVGIILVVNAISINYNKRIDITELSQFTLTSQTRDILTEMKMPVTILCFFTPTDQYGIGTYATSLLDEYKNYSDLLTVKVIDPDERPDEARKYSISQYQTVVFESEIGRRAVPPENILQKAEHSFTSAILEVTGTAQKTVYFLTGHGEAGITAEYAYATQALQDNLYRVQTLDLMISQAVPEDCTALIIPAPQRQMTALEYKILTAYIEDNGRVLFLINPGTTSDDFRSIFSQYYMDIEGGTLIDPSTYVSPNKDSVLVPRTRNQFGLTETYFPGAAAITPRENYPDNIVLLPLLYSSAYSWMEMNLEAGTEPEFNESIETLGSRAIAVMMYVEPPEEMLNEDGSIPEGVPYTQLIVIGDSDFASNQHFYNGDNAYQFLYMIEYLTSGEQIVSIERKILPYRSLVLTTEEKTFIQVASVGLLPFIVLVAGAVIWWRRR